LYLLKEEFMRFKAVLASSLLVVGLIGRAQAADVRWSQHEQMQKIDLGRPITIEPGYQATVCINGEPDDTVDALCQSLTESSELEDDLIKSSKRDVAYRIDNKIEGLRAVMLGSNTFPIQAWYLLTPQQRIAKTINVPEGMKAWLCESLPQDI
jgi:hypothetical protein